MVHGILGLYSLDLRPILSLSLSLSLSLMLSSLVPTNNRPTVQSESNTEKSAEINSTVFLHSSTKKETCDFSNL